MFLLVIEKDNVIDVIDNTSKYEDIEEMCLKFIKNATLILEDCEAQNTGMFYKKINDQKYIIYECVDNSGYIWEDWTLKERCILNVLHYHPDEIKQTYAKVVKSK